MRKASTGVAVMIVLLILVSPTPPAFAEWRVQHEGGFNGAIDLSTSLDGSRIYVAAESNTDEQERDYLTIALDAATGGVIWEARYGQFGTYNAPAEVAAGPSGTRVFVTGRGLGDGWSGMVTVAYDAETGAELWSGVSGGAGMAGSGHAMALGPGGGRVFVAGSTNDGRFTTIVYGASTGSQLWTRHLVGHRSEPHRDAALALTLGTDGGSVLLTGSVLDRKDQGAENVMTAAYRASDGRLLWARRYDGAPRHSGGERGIDIATVGDVALVAVDGRKHSALLAYDAGTGRSRWTRSWPGRSTALFHPRGIEGGGVRAFVTGSLRGLDGDYRTRTFAISPSTGRPLWTASRPGGVPWDLAMDLLEPALYVLRTEVSGGSVIGYGLRDGVLLGTAQDAGLGQWGALVPDPDSSDVFIAWTESSDYYQPTMVIARRKL